MIKQRIISLLKRSPWDYIGFTIAVVAVVFNLSIYRLELTSKVDPNDNPFQFALVHRTNDIWDYATSVCGINPICFVSHLVDHWVPNWAQGYSLPYYYSHIPQILTVFIFRLMSFIQLIPATEQSLFHLYHWGIYILLCCFPLSVFVALKIIRLPTIVAGVGAFLASQLSTDGLYGLDPSSFLWRGYGLSSQLYAMIPLPLAIAFAFRLFNQPTMRKQTVIQRFQFELTRPFLLVSILCTAFTFSGHLGVGLMVLFSIGILAISPVVTQLLLKAPRDIVLSTSISSVIRLVLVAGGAIFILSYWIVPAFIHNRYHNISFWDPVWKFNSWGWKEVMILFLNGNLVDFGRFPIITLLMLFGAATTYLLSLHAKPSTDKLIPAPYPFLAFSYLFVFWLLFFFGRATWGGLIDVIPGMKEFHQSRFIVGIHISSLFLTPIGIYTACIYLSRLYPSIRSIIQTIAAFSEETTSEKPTAPKTSPLVTMRTVHVLTLFVGVLVCFVAAPQTVRYAEFNDTLILRGNENYAKQHSDVDRLIHELRQNTPARVYTGRGGGWGKELQIAETTYFMHLSTYGIPVILWLPETWSPNSDVEQFFVEENITHYNLMNVSHVVTPTTLQPQPFWELVSESPQWKRYHVPTEGYFTTGIQPAVIQIEKTNYVNLVRLWLQSEYPTQKLFPQLTFDHQEMMSSPLPAFQMLDEGTYQIRDGTRFGLFGSVPTYESKNTILPTLQGTSTSKEDMQFSTQVTVPDGCQNCLVILKQSFHPNWKATVDGKPVKTKIVFPYYVGITVDEAGTHNITVTYTPSRLKIALLLLVLVTGSCLGLLTIRQRKNSLLTLYSQKRKTR